jgi:YD repeat-containing protein
MQLNSNRWFISIICLVGLFACTDHRLGGSLSPVRLRLSSTTGNASGGILTATYTYDSQNRLSTISRGNNSLGIFSYDDSVKPYSTTGVYATYKEYPDPADRTTGSAILLSYESGYFSTVRHHIINSAIYTSVVDKYIYYTLDDNKHVTAAIEQPDRNSSVYYFSNYSYTGDNPTAAQFIAQRSSQYRDVYEYDDKVNPFFGSIDLNLTDVQRFARNNLVKKTSIDPNGNVLATVGYQYEYNQQGLPVKRTSIRGNLEIVTYTYESY